MIEPSATGVPSERTTVPTRIVAGGRKTSASRREQRGQIDSIHSTVHSTVLIEIGGTPRRRRRERAPTRGEAGRSQTCREGDEPDAAGAVAPENDARSAPANMPRTNSTVPLIPRRTAPSRIAAASRRATTGSCPR